MTGNKFEWALFGWLTGFLFGAFLVLIVNIQIGRYDDLEDRYTVQELTDAIAARQVNIASEIVELEESR